jgi:formylglycine-generating enzyme required for sulfatase activity
VGALFVVALAAYWNQDRLKRELYRLTSADPLLTTQERALEAGRSFKECSDCPEMVVVPAGRFTMGSPEGQGDDSERPPHDVTIEKPFAVAKFELTFAEWDACAAHGDCYPRVSDNGWGRGRRPAINVGWDDAQAYVKWLSWFTGKPYRLLSEAEYEYAARAGTTTKYPWGDDIKLDGKAMANCAACGSQWDGRQTAPVCGSQEDNKQTPPVCTFAANRFGLYDMVGNVWEWTEDCWNGNYQGAAADGSAWTSGDCSRRVGRGGSWDDVPDLLRSAYRYWVVTDLRDFNLGFRVARTLSP